MRFLLSRGPPQTREAFSFFIEIAADQEGNELWATDCAHLKVVDGGCYYLVTVIDDFTGVSTYRYWCCTRLCYGSSEPSWRKWRCLKKGFLTVVREEDSSWKRRGKAVLQSARATGWQEKGSGGDRGIRTPDLCHDMTVVLHSSPHFFWSYTHYTTYYAFSPGSILREQLLAKTGQDRKGFTKARNRHLPFPHENSFFANTSTGRFYRRVSWTVS